MDRLVLVGVVGFALGILLYSFVSFGWSGVSFALFLSLVFLFVRFWKKQGLFLAASIGMLAATLGMARFLLAPSAIPPEFASLFGTRAVIEGVVVADPDLREATQRLTVEVQEEGATTKMLVVAPLYPEVRYGETIRAEGNVERPEPFDTDGGRVFRYDQFLAKDGIFALMYQAQVEVVAPRSGAFMHVRGGLSDLKFSGIDALSRALPEPQASLAAGLILGGKQGLGESLLDDFIRSGLVHIVVLSGYNVMIVAEFIMRLFGFLSRRWAAAAGALAIGAFVLAAGAGPASIRAGLMAGIALYGRATGRTYDAFRALLFSGLLMLLWNPLTLTHDPGFQLSFVATLGLIFGAPVTERWFAFMKSGPAPLENRARKTDNEKDSTSLTGFLREIAAATVAAQISVLPLLLYQNGLLSVVAFPTNLLVLPVVPFAMLASFIAMLAGAVVPSLAPVVGLPAYVLLSLITGAVEIAARLPLAAFSIPAFPFPFVVLAYALLAWYVVRVTRSLPQGASRTRSS